MDRSEFDEQHTAGRLHASGNATAIAPESAPEVAGPVADVVEPAVVELLHDAGLTAGRTLGLRPGTFRLGPRRSNEGGLVAGAPDAVSFDLVIGADGDTTLTAGPEPVAVEGVLVDRTVHLDDGDVIQLTTDQFVLRSLISTHPPRTSPTVTPRVVPAPSLPSMSRWLWLFAAVALIGFALGFSRTSFFGLCLIGLGGIVATLILRMRRHDKARHAHTTQISNARSLFFNEIVDSRKAAAESLRSEANTPATVARRAAVMPRSADTRIYATVASGDRSWSPPVVCHRDPGWDHHVVANELAFLPAIPFTIDLDAGPIAIIGPRRAILAVGRHIVTTALVASPPNKSVSVETAVPADWRWLTPASTSVLRVLDGVDGAWEPRTVVLASSFETLSAMGDTSVFGHVVHIEENGGAAIRQSDGGGGDGFIPHGITEEQARQLHQLINRPETIIYSDDGLSAAMLVQPGQDSLDSDRLLVTGSDRSRTKDVLATAALRQAVRYPDRSIFILDRGDRALIRLAQLDACRRYVTLDQIEKVEFMLTELEAIEKETTDLRLLLLAPDLWEAVAFYRNGGRPDLAERIDQLVDRMEVLPMAASAPDLTRVPRSSFLVWVNTDNADRAEATTTDHSDSTVSQLIDLTNLPGIDLTGSVARLATSLNQENSA